MCRPNVLTDRSNTMLLWISKNSFHTVRSFLTAILGTTETDDRSLFLSKLVYLFRNSHRNLLSCASLSKNSIQRNQWDYSVGFWCFRKNCACRRISICLITSCANCYWILGDSRKELVCRYRLPKKKLLFVEYSTTFFFGIYFQPEFIFT